MKVKFLPSQPHCYAFGGFDIQMLSSSEAVRECGVDITKLDIWSRDDDFDILHCWGLGFAQYENYHWTKKSGKKLVATILMHDMESLFDRAKFKVSSLISKQRVIKNMLKMPDKVVVVNEQQANICTDYYDIPEKKVHIIPHIVGDIFFKQTFDRAIQIPNNQYVLTTGNICQRKNQVLLAKACVEQKIKLIIIGKVLTGEEDYGKQLAALTIKYSHLLTWIPELKENSEELVEYYRNCTLFALPSYVEQQPISLLEAAASRKPLLVSDRKYGMQKFYENAYLVNPASLSSISAGLAAILQNTEKYRVPIAAISECKRERVGSAYKKIYQEIA